MARTMKTARKKKGKKKKGSAKGQKPAADKKQDAETVDVQVPESKGDLRTVVRLCVGLLFM